MSFAIEFHQSQTVYYLNGIYIGNQGGHFEAWFLTLEELLAFDRYDYLFLLLLPMVGLTESERGKVQILVAERLAKIPIFVNKKEYIAKCIVNGLIIDSDWLQVENVGITSTQNHCVRNISKYPSDKDDIIKLNQALKDFVLLSGSESED